jgi:hypothetical protein
MASRAVTCVTSVRWVVSMRKSLQSAAIAAAFILSCAGVTHASDEIVDAPLPPRELSTPAPSSTEKKRLPSGLDEIDAVAALEGIRIALTEVADGGTYVWHRRDGLLSGMAQPTTSFKDASGLPCRNLTVMLNTYGRSSRIDGTACRFGADRWNLTG